ncbi:MAG: FIST C-terminal domain-containing protein [Nitrosomonadales bacterium]|nr:FIST C-terminal domain-containing protein [Nitrosomonadales bacterium]
MSETKLRYFDTLDVSALATTLDAWKAVHPEMGVLVLLPEAEKDAVAQLQALFAERGIPLVGGIFPALIAEGVFHRQGAWLMRFDTMPYVALHEGLQPGDAGAMQAAEAIAAGVRPHLRGTRQEASLFMLVDAQIPNISTLLDSLYLQLANRVHYVGANTGSETFQPMPCLFDATRIVQDGVLVMLLSGHHGAILEHGYCVPPQTMNATSTVGNRIIQIDWRPAFTVYQELIQAQYGVEVTRENFYEYGVHFPFGILRANHNVVVRIPVALGDDDSLFCVGEVPPNSVLALLDSPKVDSVQTLEALTQGLAGLNGGSVDEDVLLFYCAGRRMHLGVPAATSEVREFTHRTGAAQVAGALSLGEIGGSTLWGYPLFHNATLVAALW